MRARVPAVLLAVALLAGCAPSPAPPPAPPRATSPVPTPAPRPGIQVEEGIAYTAPAGQELLLDAYLPGSPTGTDGPVPAVVVVHGGGFSGGSRAGPDAGPVAAALASAGIAAFSVDYRLLPATYPAAVQDVQAAVAWLRSPEQTARFGIDPRRIGLFGGSAGAILVAQAATAGEGPAGTGARVSAVVAMSGLYDADPALPDAAGDQLSVALDYLGCADLADCPAVAKASPLAAVDASDPPFFLSHAVEESLPVASAERFAAGLQAAGVAVELRVLPGAGHSVALLDRELAAEILAFYHAFL